MHNFSAQFQGTINTNFGQKILDFLNEEKTIVMLETATYLSRPAIEALVPSLEARLLYVACTRAMEKLDISNMQPLFNRLFANKIRS